MTVDVPDFDEDLSGYSAIEIEEDGTTVCHATITDYVDGEEIQTTECRAARIEIIDTMPRKKSDAKMCEDCWPESVIDEED